MTMSPREQNRTFWIVIGSFEEAASSSLNKPHAVTQTTYWHINSNKSDADICVSFIDKSTPM